jgi:hypothetical protein
MILGLRAWVQAYTENNQVLRETWYKTQPNYSDFNDPNAYSEVEIE